MHKRMMGCIGLGMMVLAALCPGDDAQHEYTFEQYDSVDTWLRPRADGFGGKVTAVDLDNRSLTINHTVLSRYPGPAAQQTRRFSLPENVTVIAENQPADLSHLKTGQMVYVYTQGEQAPANTRAKFIYLLKGTSVSEAWFPEIRRYPDGQTGCMFFDDFESGDFTKWNFYSGCTGILSRDPLAGDHSVTMNCWLDGVTKDQLGISGFPQVSEIWIKFRMRFEPLSDGAGNFVVFRPFPKPNAGAQIFAVRIFAPKDTYEHWNFGVQVAQSDHQRGTIQLEPGKAYTLKMRWVDASGPNASDGTVQTWVNGMPDVQAEGSVATWAGHDQTKRYIERFVMGVQHTGDHRREDFRLVLDDVWIGTRDPDRALPDNAVLFWNGETEEQQKTGPHGKHAGVTDAHARTGTHAAAMGRGVHHYPELRSNTPYNLKPDDELWFWVKADREVDDSFSVILMNGLGMSNHVDIGPYIENDKLTTTYQHVRIPAAAFLNDAFTGERTFMMEMGRKPWPKQPYTLYVDDIYFIPGQALPAP